VKRFLAIFVLTPREQRLVIFIVIALVIGASIKHYRDLQAYRGSKPLLVPIVSPTPNER
jgi:hypothetical protein